MPVDPSIPLGVRPAQFNMGDVFSAMQGMQQMRTQSLQLRQAQDAQADSDALNTAMQRAPIGADGQPDYFAVATHLEGTGHARVGQQVRKFGDERVKAQQEQAEKALKLEADRYKAIDTRGGIAYNKLIAAENDPSTWPAARKEIAGLMPQLADKLPERPDAAFFTTAKKWWENTSDALKTRAQIVSELSSNLGVKRDARETDEYYTKVLSKWLPTTGDQAEWSDALDKGRKMGVPETTLAKFGDTYSPEAAARARQLGLNDTRQLQSKEVMVDGQRVQANYDPQTGTYSMPGSSQTLKNVKPAPPQVDPALAEIRALTADNMRRRAAEHPDLSPAQFNMANKLADDFARDSKTYRDRADSMQTIAAGAKDPSAAGDLSLIFSYMKMLDPGSAVRESEQANAQNATGVPDKIRNLYNQVMTGQRLNPDQRGDFVKRAGMIFEGAQKRQDGIVRTYSSRAQRANLPADMVVMDYGLGATATTTAPGAAAAGGFEQLIDPNGVPRNVPADKVAEFLRRGGKRPH